MAVDDRILERFNDALIELRDNMREYDAISPWDIKARRRKSSSLASLLVVLVESRGTTTSLLKHIGLDTSLKVISSVEDIAAGGHSLPLAAISFTLPAQDFPVFAPRGLQKKKYPKLPLHDWWQEDVLGPHSSLSRRTLCKTVRDKDGFGHVDRNISDESYLLLTQFGASEVKYQKLLGGSMLLLGLGLTNERSKIYVYREWVPENAIPPHPISGELPVPGGVAASLRQMAEELLTSLKRIGF